MPSLIRLYLPQHFSVGAKLEIPKEEHDYYRRVRRAQGDVELFNQEGQIARGKFLETGFFLIESVETTLQPQYQLRVCVGLPENAIIPDLIRSLSELGAEELIFFAADRSQSAAKRLKSENLERWMKISLESARQCGRGRPLQVRIDDWEKLALQSTSSQKWFFDERLGPNSRSHPLLEKAEAGLIVVGCEGGFTDHERRKAEKLDFAFVHFPTPILRVATAVPVAAFYAIERLTQRLSDAEDRKINFLSSEDED